MSSSSLLPCCPILAVVITVTLNVNQVSAFSSLSTFFSLYPTDVLLSSAQRTAKNRLSHSNSLLKAFPGGKDNNFSNDDEDDDTYDDEPPELSLSPQEFLYKIQQNYKGTNGKGPVPSAIPSFGMGTARYRSRSRPAFGSKNTAGNDIATAYLCTNCNAEYLQWRGRCGTCHEWNTIQEIRVKRKRGGFGFIDEMEGTVKGKSSRKTFQKRGTSWLDGVRGDSFGFVGQERGGGPVRLTDVYGEFFPSVEGNDTRWKDAYYNGYREERTQVPGDPEINAVLGGGFMPGSLTLVGGDPGTSGDTSVTS